MNKDELGLNREKYEKWIPIREKKKRIQITKNIRKLPSNYTQKTMQTTQFELHKTTWTTQKKTT